MSENYGQDTQDEMSFLENLGTYRENGVPLERKVLLKNYIDSTNLREKWGHIDKASVIEYAKKLLEIELLKV